MDFAVVGLECLVDPKGGGGVSSKVDLDLETKVKRSWIWVGQAREV
jgi:hypothetical protein